MGEKITDALKACSRGSFVRAAACALLALVSPLGEARVPSEPGAGVLLGTNAYGKTAASPVGWDVYLAGGLRTVVGAPFSGVATTQFASRATDGRRFDHT